MEATDAMHRYPHRLTYLPTHRELGDVMWERIQRELRGATGPRVAWWFHRLLALVFLIAWFSLGVQVHTLIGTGGLMPVEVLAERIAIRGDVPWTAFPSVFRWAASDAALTVGILMGLGASVAALIDRGARWAFVFQAFLYLSFTVAARDFLSFQWDSMLIECGVLAAFLPAGKPNPWPHGAFRFLVLKLYVESGIAKWQSYLGDWHDGSAMTFYYETAPIPSPLAWYAHWLPVGWHHLESWGTLVLELGVPWLMFFGRVPRRVALLTLTAFQLINLATANYGYFVYLSLALHLFLLEESDLERLGIWARRRFGRGKQQVMDWWERTARPDSRPLSGWRGQLHRVAKIAGPVLLTLYVAASLLEAGAAFGAIERSAASGLREIYLPYRVVNTYHLFGHITRERLEPQFEVLVGEEWRELDFHYKPGSVDRAPPFVAPHQPRVDFRLWFYGLGYRRRTPRYVDNLLERLCEPRGPVWDLFATPMPDGVLGARVVIWQYHFARPGAGDSQNWWDRERLATPRAVRCSDLAR